MNTATPSFHLLKRKMQEPSLTPVFLSTLHSGSIPKSYHQLSFQTRRESDHLPPLPALVQAVIYQSPRFYLASLPLALQAYTLSRHSRLRILPVKSVHITQSKGPTGAGQHTLRPPPHCLQDSCLWAFAFAVPHAWKAFPPETTEVHSFPSGFCSNATFSGEPLTTHPV